ncbi:MAG: FAD-dependent oxidoreductase [Planctomycetaceae bacterium]|nr:FAD-dependent oxidoreductase [Planctomycetaceae bacterium]
MKTLLHIVFAAALLFFFVSFLSAQAEKHLFIEAESFSDYGGWVLDQQYMDQMGSPVLMAHGIGEPVQDATVKIRFPQAGKYRVFVRTRNWVAPWNPKYAPGQFQLKLDGTVLEDKYGTEGNEWHWQKGGTVDVEENKLDYVLALHDLTGWDGRVDAIMFSSDADYTPPESIAEIEKIRRKALALPDVPPNASRSPYDLVVVGAGYPGICAAVGAARLGLNVALIQDRPYIGGNASPEIRVGLAGKICMPPYPNLGNLVYQLKSSDPFEYEVHGKTYKQREMGIVKGEKNLHLFPYTRMTKVEMDGKKVKAVIGKDVVNGKELRFEGKLFADCTGDGNLGYLAGADFRVGREAKSETGESMAPDAADNQIMGSTLLWRTENSKTPTTFPVLPWAFQFTKESILPEIVTNWNWETGMRRDQVAEIERIRDHGFMAIYGHWSYLKNNEDDRWTPLIQNKKLAEVPYIAGKRESRRLMGDYILQEQDFRENKPYPDASVTCTWPIDLHYANEYSLKYFPGEEFRTYCTHDRYNPQAIPYRVFYSRNINNMFMAGRNISVTHVAMGPTRVMLTGGMMGEVVAMAAAVCVKHNALPRDVYTTHLSELKDLMNKGVAPPPPAYEFPLPWTRTAGENLARQAKASASSEHDSGQYPAKFANDGVVDTQHDSRRWVSGSGREHWLQLEFRKLVTVNAMHFATGWAGRKAPIHDCILQYEKDGEWVNIPDSKIAHNLGTFVGAKFKPVTASKFRLYITKASDNTARLWELELYNAP